MVDLPKPVYRKSLSHVRHPWEEGVGEICKIYQGFSQRRYFFYIGEDVIMQACQEKR